MVLPEKFNEIVRIILTTEEASFDDSASPASAESWDSVTHVILLTALEDEFGISFSDEEMKSIKTLEDLRGSVLEKLKEKADA